MFCPEDGGTCDSVAYTTAGACYVCGSCGTHWFYDGSEGSYQVIEDIEDCPLCKGAERA